MKVDVPVRIAVQLTNEYADYQDVRDTVRRLEDLGVDVVFNWDHFFPLFGPSGGPHLECWTMLGAIAEQTSRVEFGPLVNCDPYRNPDLQADMARTIDHISGGRFLFGIGAGWARRDFDEYGYPFGTAGQRLDQLALDLPRIKQRWQRLNPAPIRPIPVIVGGAGERKTLRTVAEHADIWHSLSDEHALRRKLVVLHDWCARVHRDPSVIEVSVTVSTPPASSGFDGLHRLHDLGVRLFQTGVHSDSLDDIRRLLQWRDSVNA